MRYFLATVGLLTLMDLSQAVMCPDHKSQCPEGTTCCLLPNGRYGCCPMPKAVCCSDHLHCCPHGKLCDLQHGRCNDEDGSYTPMHRKQPAELVVAENDIVCGHHESTCPDGTTCCPLATGVWACCPAPKAVCCSDHLHCCPHGTICDVQEGRCKKPGTLTSVAWSKKVKAKVIKHPYAMPSVTCEDGATKCLGHTTCCAQDDGRSACCPFNDGVCCSSKGHCCPFGFRCDDEKEECVKQKDDEIITMTWTTVSSGQSEEIEENEATDGDIILGKIQCPNGSECPARTTCCPHANSRLYSCCPLDKAVCCDQMCCPSGYTCGSNRKCRKDNSIKTLITRFFH